MLIRESVKSARYAKVLEGEWAEMRNLPHLLEVANTNPNHRKYDHIIMSNQEKTKKKRKEKKVFFPMRIGLIPSRIKNNADR